MHLEHGFARDATSPEVTGRALRGHDLEPEFVEPTYDRSGRGLVAVVDRHDHPSLQRERSVGRDLCLGKREPEAVRPAHHLARRAHLGAELRVGVGDLVEREDGFFNRHVAHHGILRKAHIRQALSGQDAGGHSGQWDSSGLAHEGYGPAGPRVDLEHVGPAFMYCVLNVDQSLDAEGPRKGPRVALHFGDVIVAEQVGRENAR